MLNTNFLMENQYLNTVPKVELHVHVEGATLPETYFAIAEKNKVNLSVDNIDEWKEYFRFKNFSHFIEVYGNAVSLLQKPEDYAYLIEKFYEYQESQNIIYTEAFLSGSFIVEKFNNDDILEAILLGIKKGERNTSSRINFIIDISRHLPKTQSKVLDLAIKGFKKQAFIGIGLGGLEIDYPPDFFVETFKKAKKAGLRLVAHAGEASGAESIWGAIKKLNVERIGHGIRCMEDKSLVNYLKEIKLPIEVSPTSNYHLGIIRKDQKHPIREMVDNNLLCTVNTDDPAMFSTNLSKEYNLLHSQGFSIEELYQLNRNAIDSAFLESAEKNILFKTLEKHKTTYNNAS